MFFPPRFLWESDRQTLDPFTVDRNRTKQNKNLGTEKQRLQRVPCGYAWPIRDKSLPHNVLEFFISKFANSFGQVLKNVNNLVSQQQQKMWRQSTPQKQSQLHIGPGL